MSGSVYSTRTSFTALDGWAGDDHTAALRAFLNSKSHIGDDNLFVGAPDLGGIAERGSARAFFESRFEPFAASADTPGYVTGYYEPELRGSRTQTLRYSVPVYGRPADLITTIAETDRARHNEAVSGFRRTAEGAVPYYTRAEIEAGGLAAQRLEVLYTDDYVELFFMQVQGSGLVHLDDGTSLRLTYAGKNGHPYTSIARVLIDAGELAADEIDMDVVKAWLRNDPARGRALMQKNESYVFFSALSKSDAMEGPRGAEGVPLTPGRSLAVDPAYIPLGSPVFVTVPDLDDEDGAPFRSLMIAQDAGSAIQGPQRGDIFFGTGMSAGAIAGHTRFAAQFHVLMRKR